MKKALT